MAQMRKFHTIFILQKSHLLSVLIFQTLFFAMLDTEAQNVRITGKVTDAVSKEKMSGVLVLIKGQEHRAVTNENGAFVLKNDQPLPIVIRVSMLGYESEEFIIKKISEEINLALTPKHIQGNEVVVFASRIPEYMLESAMSIERLNVNDIQKSAATSFYDGLVNLKGVEQSTQSFTFKSINTRGFNSNGNVRFNQFIDGMDNQAPGLNFAVGNIVGISDLDLESAELIPGSSSALYGAGGINGTLLLKSKNPFRYEGLSMQLKSGVNHVDNKQQSIHGWNDVQLRYAKAWNNKFAFKVNLSYVKADDWRAQDESNYNRTAMQAKSGDRNTDPVYDGINVYGDEIKANMRNVAQAVSQGGRQIFTEQYKINTGTLPTETQVQDFLSTDPKVSPYYLGLQNGIIPNQEVSRTGYAEQDLVNYSTKSLRTNTSFNYKIKPGLEASAQAYWGTGNSLYTGADRYSFNNFKLGQYKLELSGDKFFVRAYTTQERSGDAYNITALASFMNEKFKPSTTWFPQYIGNYLAAVSLGSDEATAHQIARSKTDIGRFEPGSVEFNSAKEDITSRNIGPEGGARFNDKTNLWHYEGMYNFSDLLPQIEIIAGASYRLYDLNSGGTIFDDLNNKISYTEYGTYVQAARKLLKDHLKIMVSVRYDKNENFKGGFSPRIAGVWTIAKDNYLRVSYQTGFRNPTAQAQYLDLLVQAGSRLTGALPSILDKYQLQTNKPYTDKSYQDFVASGYTNPSLLEAYTFNTFKPERVQAYEIGYRTLLAKTLTVDAYFYYNNYHDFLTSAVVWQNQTPGNITGMYSPVRYEVSVNSTQNVKSKGWALGLDYQWKKFNFTGNVSHDELSTLPQEFFNSYNTPAYRYNLGISSARLVKNIGFNIVYRWQDEFIWRAKFAVGEVPAYGSLDGQLSFKMPAYQSLIKIGGSNLLNSYYKTSFGNPTIGGMYYVSLLFDPFVR